MERVNGKSLSSFIGIKTQHIKNRKKKRILKNESTVVGKNNKKELEKRTATNLQYPQRLLYVNYIVFPQALITV